MLWEAAMLPIGLNRDHGSLLHVGGSHAADRFKS